VTYRIRQRVLVAAASLAVVSSIVLLDAQRREPGKPPLRQAIEASLKVGGLSYDSREPGRCTHAPTAAIYSVISEMWSVQQSSDGRSLTLTLWRPKDGSGDMVTLSVNNGSASHEINTVRGGGATRGAGKVAFEKSGAGGVFTITGKTGDGAAVSGTISCNAFAPHVAEGGL